ncbi:CGNR zinc finger domain-containing protein [Streptacidiphilus sp. P02-A3a]|uniref:CGNR zinc finger domain-containing protein n=1 Tax=Streptacidiphilus sp. P02-A3a TaxID=2704468 RepID=UPI001CDCFBA7|nr:CGNR zinc finger domain-containing protein [Streptacidiphilus sp. P02-A3a]
MARIEGVPAGRHSPSVNARRTAALVNALSAEDPTVEQVAGVLRAHGEGEPLTLRAADVAAMRDAAALLREVFAAEDAGRAASRLNDLLVRHTGPLRLTSHGGSAPFHPHLDRDDDGPWGEWFLASSCLALAVLLWGGQRAPGGLCASPSCRNVYVTVGSGLNQRFCSRRCATRERVAAHRRGNG